MPTFHTGNYWDAWEDADLFLFTSNGIVGVKGNLIMGAGTAYQVMQRFPGINLRFGAQLQKGKNRYGLLIDSATKIGAFQTKLHFRNPSPLELIDFSTEKLLEWIEEIPGKTIHMPFPGIGYGKLTTDEVMPILEKLPPEVHIWQKK